MLTSAKGNTWPFGHKLVFPRKSNSALFKLVLGALDNNSVWIMSQSPQGQRGSWYTQQKYRQEAIFTIFFFFSGEKKRLIWKCY